MGIPPSESAGADYLTLRCALSARAFGSTQTPPQRPRPVTGSDYPHKEKSDVFCYDTTGFAGGSRQRITRGCSTMATHNAAAATPTTKVVPAAGDEVSALTAAQFAMHVHIHQEVSAQAAAVHEVFTTTLAMTFVRGH